LLVRARFRLPCGQSAASVTCGGRTDTRHGTVQNQRSWRVCRVASPDRRR
jgi:hypothetical protein